MHDGMKLWAELTHKTALIMYEAPWEKRPMFS